MKKILTTILIILSFLLPMRALAFDPAAYRPAAPYGLRAGINGNSEHTSEVFLSWQHKTFGLGYLITKIYPDGHKEKFTLMGANDDINCSGKGGFFFDPLVEKNQTYTYEVRAFVPATMKFSDPATITVNIKYGDYIGCSAHPSKEVSLNYSNARIKIAIANQDNKTYQIFLDGKLAKTTNKEVVTLWPVFGQNHKIKIVEKSDSTDSLSIVKKAEACTYEKFNKEYDVQYGHMDFLSKFIGSINSIKKIFTIIK